MKNTKFFEFFNPVKIVAGNRALDGIPAELERINTKRPLLISDMGVKEAGLVDILLKSVGESGFGFAGAFFDVPPDSGTKTVALAASIYREKHCDGIVALGGGSVIDTAKAVNILVSKKGDDLSVYSGAGAITGRLMPFAVIPTTSGTGSECTAVAMIRDDDTNRKLSFVSLSLLPDAAFIDPRMTLSLPPLITAATGMDALTHAVECCYCHGKNPLSDLYAGKAISILFNRLESAVKHPQNSDIRLDLALASTLAGIAFSNSMVGLVHSLGHATGSICKVPHGTAMAIFLPDVLSHNLEKRSEEIGELLLHITGPEKFYKIPDTERANTVIKSIIDLRENLNKYAGLPRKLSETGEVEYEILSKIARYAIDDPSIAFNPEEADYNDCLALLEKCY